MISQLQKVLPFNSAQTYSLRIAVFIKKAVMVEIESDLIFAQPVHHLVKHFEFLDYVRLFGHFVTADLNLTPILDTSRVSATKT